MKLLKRFPAFPQILSAYAMIAFMLFTWCILWFFWNLTSWLNFMDLGLLLATFSYAMLVSFLEGLTVLALLLVVSFVLPASWLRDHFVARGSLATISLLGLIMLRDYWITSDNYLLKPMSVFGLVLAVLMAILLFLAVKFSWMDKALNVLAERLTVFLYLFLPLSALSLLVVLIRNLFS